MDVVKNKKPGSAHNRRWIGGAAIVVLLALLGTGLAIGLAPRSARSAAADELSVVSRKDATAQITVLGSVQPLALQTMSAPSNAKVQIVHVKPGQQVAKGEALITLSNEELDKELVAAQLRYAQARSAIVMTTAQAKADVASARAQHLKSIGAKSQAEAKHRAIQEVFRDGVVSRLKVDAAAASVRAAEADADAARVRYQAAKTVAQARIASRRKEAEILRRQRDRTRNKHEGLVLRAQDGGTVVEVLARDVGATVSAGEPLLRVIDNSGYYVRLKIPESEATFVQAGDEVELDMAGRRRTGTITRIAPTAKEGYVVAVVGLLGSAKQTLRIDTTVSARIQLEYGQDLLLVAVPEHVSSNEKALVYVESRGDDKVAEARWVDFGRRFGGEIVVDHGLQAGERVVTGKAPTAAHERIEITQ